MAKRKRNPKTEQFSVSVMDAITHKILWSWLFNRSSFIIALVSAVVVILVSSFCLLAYTPLKNFIPGYPDAHTKYAIVQNAIKADSLERIVARWEFYTENLKRVLGGEDPVRIDSLVRTYAADADSVADLSGLAARDSALRKMVTETERFGLTSTERKLPIEGIHFFIPLKGVISTPFDKSLHPYIDIAAPKNAVVTSVLDGTVIEAAWNDEKGNVIIIQHDNDIVSVYKHNQKLLKSQGEKVSAGTPVALVGKPDASTECHLHFELWYRGEAVDPAKYINFQ